MLKLLKKKRKNLLKNKILNFTLSLQKNSKTAFLYAQHNAIIDCDKIHEQIFKYYLQDDEDFEDLDFIKFKDYDIHIFLNSALLQGGKEVENKALFFGALDENESFKANVPAYHFNPEYEEFDLGTVTVFLNNTTLTLLNYSLVNESLNIKLELTNKESIRALEKAKQSLQEKAKQDEETKMSKASLYAVIESDIIKCPHNGQVILKSNKGKNFKSNGVPLILESDYINSNILGCTNTVAGIAAPCTKVVSIKGTTSLKKVNGEGVILQDLVVNSLSDKGFNLQCLSKPNKFLFDYSFSVKDDDEGKAKELNHSFNNAKLRLHYKINSQQKDNLPLYEITLNDSLLSSTCESLKPLDIDLEKDTEDLKQTKTNLLHSLKAEFKKDTVFKQLKLKIDTNLVYIYLIVPQNIPKPYKQDFKNYENKDYGVAEFKQIHSYTSIKALKPSEEELKKEMPNYTEFSFVFMTPYKAKKLRLEFAFGLDKHIQEQDEKEQNKAQSFVVANGGR